MARFRLIVAAVVLTLASFTQAGAQESDDNAAEAPLDLAAMLLRPGDVVEGYGVFSARSWTAAERAAGYADLSGGETDDELALLEDAGYVRGHEQVIGTEAAVELDEPQAAALIASYLYEFASAQGATAAYEHVENELESQPQAEDVVGTRQFGRTSEVTTFTGIAPDSGVPSESIELSFVDGRLYGGVTITLFRWDETELEVGESAQPLPAANLDTVETLAEFFLQRIDDVRDGGAPGLSLSVLRVNDPGGNRSVLDQYTVYDGEVVSIFGESDEDFAARVEEYGDATAVYEFERPLGNSYYVTRLAQFPSQDAASAWLAGSADALVREGSLYDDLVPVETSEVFGDESAALSYVYHLGETDDVRGHIIWIRAGSVVARVQADAMPEASLQGVEELAQTQLACLEGAGACDPIEPPSALSFQLSTSRA